VAPCTKRVSPLEEITMSQSCVSVGEWRDDRSGTLNGVGIQAAAINPAGQVVGVSLTESGDDHATLWTRK
jgi:probable HAF family extracellular repeat protein